MSIKNTFCVTGGKAYTDIDVLACASAYTHLLSLQGKKAAGVISPQLNQTISRSVRGWPYSLHHEWTQRSSSDLYIAVDVSDPDFFFEFVVPDQICEVFDHHFGHEEFWQSRLGQHAYIEKIGACATLIWEKYKMWDRAHQISTVNANLLYTAIFANTLDFKSHVTHERDRTAFEEIFPHTSLSKDWKQQYYLEVQEDITSDIAGSIAKDTKLLRYSGEDLFFGQLELWNAKDLIAGRIGDTQFRQLAVKWKREEPQYLVNVVSIEEERCYLMSNVPTLLEFLHAITEGVRKSTCIETPRIWQRKEILKEIKKGQFL